MLSAETSGRQRDQDNTEEKEGFPLGLFTDCCLDSACVDGVRDWSERSALSLSMNALNGLSSCNLRNGLWGKRGADVRKV